MNGGVACEDFRVRFAYLGYRVDIRGTDNYDINYFPIALATRVTETTLGEGVIIMNQHAYYSKGNIMHYSGKVEHFNNFVDTKSMKVGGKQHTLPKNDCMIPIAINNGIPCVTLRPWTNQEWLKFPHPVLNSDADWDPNCICSLGGVEKEIWFDTQLSISQDPSNETFNDNGEFHNVNQQSMHYFVDKSINACV